MSGTLGRRPATRQTGTERFHAAGVDLGFDLLGFWQWSTSDLLSNVTRGRLAEYLVARALGLNIDGVRDDWAPFDLCTPSGLRIEVKSAAFIQSWHQTRLSSIQFGVPPTRAWNADTSVLSEIAQRQADVYVFALLCHANKSTVDPLNVDHWAFFVLPTGILNARTRSQQSITLRTLERLCPGRIAYEDLPGAVERAAVIASGAPTR